MNSLPVYADPTWVAPTTRGIEVLQLQNADLAESCVWVPTDVQQGMAPLPIYPARADLEVEV